MAVTNYKRGSLNPVVYFINSAGEIDLPPSTDQALAIRDTMRRRGYELKEAGSIPEIDELSERIFEQERRKMEKQLELTVAMVTELKRASRDRMLARAVSSSTSPFERDFLLYYLQIHDPEKKAKYMEQFMHRQMYFEQREHDGNNAFLDLVDKAVPDAKDTECQRCHRFRRISGSKLCHRCAAEVGEEIQRAR